MPPARVVATLLVYDNLSAFTHVVRCIADQTRLPEAVVIVDNGSDQALSLDPVPANLRSRTQLLRLATNVGVGAGHNHAVAAALQTGPDFIWVLEHDTFPDPTCLEDLLGVFASDPDPTLGVVEPHLTRNRFDRDVYELPGDVVSVERTTFNGILARRQMLEDVGPIREDLFVGLEDWDYSKRMLARGWRMTMLRKPLGIHPNRNPGGPMIPSPMRHYYSSRNELILSGRPTPKRVVRQFVGIVTDLVQYRSLALPRARAGALVDGLRNRGGQTRRSFNA